MERTLGRLAVIVALPLRVQSGSVMFALTTPQQIRKDGMAIHPPDDDDDNSSASETRIINIQNRRIKPGAIRANTERRASAKNTVDRGV
jgi:hypothetical protein